MIDIKKVENKIRQIQRSNSNKSLEILQFPIDLIEK
jgi:hypothetical protein